jgi:hypothetical protein
LERTRWFPEQKKQELIYEMMSVDLDRTESVYMNFNPSTNPIRQKIYDELKDKSFIKKEMIGNGGDYRNYLMNLKKHKYIISPPGNGIDCHRNWEAIYMGCIPIVLDSYFNQNIYNELNVLIVKSFSNPYESISSYGNNDNSIEYKNEWIKKIKNL